MSTATTTKTVYVRNEAGEFVCPHCGETKARQNTMFYHMKKHTGDMKYVCSVPGCDKRFIQKSGLTQHMAQAHPVGLPEWGCPCCDHTCRMKANMAIHIARMHGAGVPPAASAGATECVVCDRTFASATAYYYHASACFGGLPEAVSLGGDSTKKAAAAAVAEPKDVAAAAEE
jgi:hypothetical protein